MSRRLGLHACALLLVLAGCDNSNHAADNKAAGTFRPAKPGVLTVATAEIPQTGFWEGTARDPIGGFEWALAQALRERFRLGRVDVVTVPFTDLVAGRVGDADLVLSQVTPTERRERDLDFSEPYLPATPAVLVRAGTRVDDIASSRDKRWAVRKGSILEAFLQDKVRPDEPVVAVDTRRQSIDALVGGSVDAVLLDLPAATAISSAFGGRLGVAGQFAADDSIAVALPEGSPNTHAVDSAIRAFQADGTLERLADRWLGVTIKGRGGAEDVPLIAVAP